MRGSRREWTVVAALRKPPRQNLGGPEKEDRWRFTLSASSDAVHR